MTAYDFQSRTKEVTWDVDGLIPSATMLFFISKAGVGKSFLAEYLAVCIVHGYDFLGIKTEPSNVLLIDQDTPLDVLNRRLHSFGSYMKEMNVKQKRKLFVKSMEGFYLSDKSLQKAISDYDNVSVVIVDSLTSVLGNLDPNRTKDMSVLSELKKVCVEHGKTLIIIHHISEHKGATANDIMTTDDPNTLTMGNSIINQQADSLFYLTSVTKSNLKDLSIRPISKRVSLGYKPFTTELIEERDNSHFEFKEFYKNREPLTECDNDILRLFLHSQKVRNTREVYLDMNQKHGMYSVRYGLKKLVERGWLTEHNSGVKRKMFSYSLRERC